SRASSAAFARSAGESAGTGAAVRGLVLELAPQPAVQTMAGSSSAVSRRVPMARPRYELRSPPRAQRSCALGEVPGHLPPLGQTGGAAERLDQVRERDAGRGEGP